MQIFNQKPSFLTAMYQDDITKPMDSDMVQHHISQMLSGIYTPLIAGSPVTIQDDNGQTITKDDITHSMLSCCGIQINTDQEAFLCTLFKKALLQYDPNLRADQIFIAQENPIAKCPIPSSNVIYVTNDLKQACAQYIQNPNAYRAFLHCTEAFVVQERHAGAMFMAKPVFDEFKAYVKNMVQIMSAKLQPAVIQKFADFNKMDLNIVEGLILRTQNGQDLEEYSFPRILMKLLIDFSQTTPNMELLTPYMSEFIIPKNLMFYDADQIARVPKQKIAQLLNECTNAMHLKYVQTGFNTINKMSTVSANMQRIYNQFGNSSMGGVSKRKMFRFSNKTIGQKGLAKRIKHIISKEYNVSMSENFQKNIIPSYLKPNRHDPDDFNKKGAIMRTIYKPDIHIYLDTSGSISEKNYRNAIKTVIYAAKKLDVNIYLNSFSSTITQETKLKLRGKSIVEIYNEFQRIPKITGGTDFANVYRYIMASKKRRKQISFMITDFGDEPLMENIKHPPKLWYIPIDVSASSWPNIKEWAEEFCKCMYYSDKNIRTKLLM